MLTLGQSHPEKGTTRHLNEKTAGEINERNGGCQTLILPVD
jgi:hypothetical protein